jgi:hypothetical protein
MMNKNDAFSLFKARGGDVFLDGMLRSEIQARQITKKKCYLECPTRRNKKMNLGPCLIKRGLRRKRYFNVYWVMEYNNAIEV